MGAAQRTRDLKVKDSRVALSLCAWLSSLLARKRVGCCETELEGGGGEGGESRLQAEWVALPLESASHERQ